MFLYLGSSDWVLRSNRVPPVIEEIENTHYCVMNKMDKGLVEHCERETLRDRTLYSHQDGSSCNNKYEGAWIVNTANDKTITLCCKHYLYFDADSEFKVKENFIRLRTKEDLEKPALAEYCSMLGEVDYSEENDAYFSCTMKSLEDSVSNNCFGVTLTDNSIVYDIDVVPLSESCPPKTVNVLENDTNKFCCAVKRVVFIDPPYGKDDEKLIMSIGAFDKSSKKFIKKTQRIGHPRYYYQISMNFMNEKLAAGTMIDYDDYWAYKIYKHNEKLPNCVEIISQKGRISWICSNYYIRQSDSSYNNLINKALEVSGNGKVFDYNMFFEKIGTTGLTVERERLTELRTIKGDFFNQYKVASNDNTIIVDIEQKNLKLNYEMNELLKKNYYGLNLWYNYAQNNN
jgi:hypothetical protein